MNLALAFAESVRANPAKTALFWGDEQFSYGEFRVTGCRVAKRLRAEFGVQPGDRIGVWLQNCPEFVPAIFGAWRAGAVVVPINNFLKPPEVEFILKDAGINILIHDKPDFEHSNVKGLRADSLAGGGNGMEEFCDVPEDALALIIYTSGTTGHPKGAMLSHANLLSNVRSCQHELMASGEDRVVVLLPMFHSFMLTVGVLLPVVIGASIVLIKTLHPPKNVIQEIIQHRATVLPAVPQFFRALAQFPPSVELPLRLCVSGGAPLPTETLRKFGERFTIPLLEGYGLSEASPVVSFTPIRGPWKAGSIGVPIRDVEVTIQDDSGAILPHREKGELCVRGPNIMQGYWNRPAETAATLRNGWLLTGDIGYVDEDGYFYITDRKKDMLLVNGINVYPREVEEVLYQFPGVKEAAVIGIPDSRKGEQPLAFVAAEEGVRVEEAVLHDFLRVRLADYKVPKRIVFLPALPRNATGKVLKTELRKLK
jgi:long-chain acyl-CoA synthetase